MIMSKYVFILHVIIILIKLFITYITKFEKGLADEEQVGYAANF